MLLWLDEQGNVTGGTNEIPASTWPQGWDFTPWNRLLMAPVQCDYIGDESEYTRAEYKLATGGPLGSTELNLWLIEGSAYNYSSPAAIRNNSGYDNQIPSENISIGHLGCLDENGQLWLLLPDNAQVLITPRVGSGNAVYFWFTSYKYPSHFEVFVRQPFPDYPKDAQGYGPGGPPIGYPVINIGSLDAGHAWWRLSCTAPTEGIYKQISTNCARWVNVEAGYGPLGSSSYDWWRMLLLEGFDKQAPGMVYGASSGATIHRTYSVGFKDKGIVDSANHVEKLSNNPGTWDTGYHSCVDETIITGKHSGVQLPRGDGTPEIFGLNLPPDSN
jgi:hypothetical protein